MSTNNQVLNTGQQAITNYDVSKIFIGNNRYENALYNNSSYDSVTLRAGMLMGRISANNYIVPLQSDASDGSQFPVGILASDYVVEDGDSVNLSLCVAGDVAEEKIIFTGQDTIETVVSSRRLRDRIAADTVGIKVVSGTEMADYDNQ